MHFGMSILLKMHPPPKKISDLFQGWVFILYLTSRQSICVFNFLGTHFMIQMMFICSHIHWQSRLFFFYERKEQQAQAFPLSLSTLTCFLCHRKLCNPWSNFQGPSCAGHQKTSDTCQISRFPPRQQAALTSEKGLLNGLCFQVSFCESKIINNDRITEWCLNY